MYFLPDQEEPGSRSSDGHIPVEYRAYLIHIASKVSFTEGKAYRILSQEILQNDYRLWYHLFFVRTPSLIHPVAEETMFVLHYMLEGRTRCYMQGFGDVLLLPNTYQGYGLPAGVRQDIWFEPGEYIAFHFSLPPSILEQIIANYPSLAAVVKNLIEDGQGAGLLPLFRMTAAISRMIQEILHCREKAVNRRLYLCERISALIYAYLGELDAYQHRMSWTTSKGIELSEIENYIRTQLIDRGELITAGQIARAKGLSMRQFRMVFSRVSEMTFDKLIHKMRMERAMELLKTGGYTIDAIAEQTGYADRANFNRAFKRYYGGSPTTFIKK
jgi:AraC-like DNA-binding protein